MKRLSRITLVLLCACGLAFAQDQQEAQQQQPAEERAALRIVHLALGSGDIDIQIDGEPRIPRVAGNATSGYVFLPPGQHEISAVRAGAAPAAGDDAAAQPPADPAAGEQPPQDPAADPMNQPPADPAAQPVDPATPLFTTSVDLEPGSYTTLVVLSTDEQTAEGDPAPQESGDPQDAQQPAELQQASQSVRDALDALDQDDLQAAQDATQSALDQIDAAAQQAEGDMATALESARGPLQEAQQALQNEDVEGARSALQQVDDQMQQVSAPPEAAEGDGAAGGEPTPAQGQAVETVVIRDQIQSLPNASQAMVRLVNVSRNGSLDLVGVLQTEADAQESEQPEEGQQQDQAEGEEQQQDDVQNQAQQEAEGQAAPVQGQDHFTGLSNLSFGAAGEHQQVPASTYHIQVQGQDGTVLLDLPDTTLESGVVYTFYASSTAEGNVLVTISVDAGVSRAQF